MFGWNWLRTILVLKECFACRKGSWHREPNSFYWLITPTLNPANPLTVRFCFWWDWTYFCLRGVRSRRNVLVSSNNTRFLRWHWLIFSGFLFTHYRWSVILIIEVHSQGWNTLFDFSTKKNKRRGARGEK
jgi:hypothetical protein